MAPGTQDFRTILVKIKGLRPDFLYIPLHPNELAIFLRQTKELKVPGQIVGADTFSEKTILKAAGEATEGVIFAMAAQPSGEPYTRFSQNFKKKFGDEPSYSSTAAYDTVRLLAEAIKKSGPTGDQIRKFL